MARRKGKSPRHSTSRTIHPQPPQGGFRMPPGVSHAKEPVAGGGMAYVFRHQKLGLLGRLVLQDVGGQTHVAMEIAGDPDDPMTAKRAAIFKPLAAELTQRLEAQSGPAVAPPGGASPSALPPSSGELVESKLMQCNRCGTGVALLIFAPEATDPGRFEDYARRMYGQVQQLKVPTYVIGPALGDGPLMERPADILQIWPERQPMQRLRPDEFNPILDQLAQTHCR